VCGARSDQFIKLDLKSCAVAILRILDQKYHEKGNDGRACIDDQLPRIRILKNGSRYGPNDNHRAARMKVEARPAACDVRLGYANIKATVLGILIAAPSYSCGRKAMRAQLRLAQPSDESARKSSSARAAISSPVISNTN